MSQPRRMFITGCASGIGRHLADRAVAAGHRVFATDIDLAGLETHAEKTGWPPDRVETQKLDVRDPNAWETAVAGAVAAMGGLDVLMNVAGYLKPAWAHEAPPGDVDKHFDINVKGVIYGTQAALKVMLPARAGHVINIASMASLAPIPGLSLYSASKYAVRAFSLAVAQELRGKGPRVTVVCPDAVQTPMLTLQENYEQAAMTFSNDKPLTVEDVGDAIFNRVLPKRPLLVMLPASRGWLARMGDLFPGLALSLMPGMNKKGLERQQRIKAGK